MSQTIIEVEAKSLNGITDEEGRQARLPSAGRGPANQEKNVPDGVKRCTRRRGSVVRRRVNVVTGFGGEAGPVQGVSPVWRQLHTIALV